MSLNNGIVSIPSHHSVDETLRRLQEVLGAKDVKVFAVVDHSGEAEKAGFQMRPCKLVIFGNPHAGTPLMLAAPAAALDLPLKILIWERSDATVWVTYNDNAYLQQRHGLPQELMANVSILSTLAAKIAQ